MAEELARRAEACGEGEDTDTELLAIRQEMLEALGGE